MRLISINFTPPKPATVQQLPTKKQWYTRFSRKAFVFFDPLPPLSSRNEFTEVWWWPSWASSMLAWVQDCLGWIIKIPGLDPEGTSHLGKASNLPVGHPRKVGKSKGNPTQQWPKLMQGLRLFLKNKLPRNLSLLEELEEGASRESRTRIWRKMVKPTDRKEPCETLSSHPLHFPLKKVHHLSSVEKPCIFCIPLKSCLVHKGWFLPPKVFSWGSPSFYIKSIFWKVDLDWSFGVCLLKREMIFFKGKRKHHFPRANCILESLVFVSSKSTFPRTGSSDCWWYYEGGYPCGWIFLFFFSGPKIKRKSFESTNKILKLKDGPKFFKTLEGEPCFFSKRWWSHRKSCGELRG